MVFVAVEGVAVTHHARGRVVAGDGQGVAQRRGDRLRKTDGHAAADHVDPADAQAGQPVRRRDGEGAVLGQRAGIARRTVGQVGFVDGQFTARHRQPGEGDRIVLGRGDDRGYDFRWCDSGGVTSRWCYQGWYYHHRRCNDWRRNQRCRGAVVRVAIAVMPLPRKLRNAVEPGSGETDGRIDPPPHFLQHDKTVAAAQRAPGSVRSNPGRPPWLQPVWVGSSPAAMAFCSCSTSVSCAWLGVTASAVSTWGD